jgi:hypothetical protein
MQTSENSRSLFNEQSLHERIRNQEIDLHQVINGYWSCVDEQVLTNLIHFYLHEAVIKKDNKEVTVKNMKYWENNGKYYYSGTDEKNIIHLTLADNIVRFIL